jgi:hypothetical protein
MVSFGQEMPEKAKESPNKGFIRTGNAGESQRESEYRPHSDRKCWRKPKRVRIKATFGQEMPEKAKGSPNTALIRTGKAEKSQRESEYRPHSDRKCWRKPKRVRIKATFGQEMPEKAKRSPNTALIRTGNAGESQRESEYRPHSDRKSRKKPKRVRIKATFGHEKLKKAKGSPNKGFIRTGNAANRQIKSEYRQNVITVTNSCSLFIYSKINKGV